MDTYLSIRQLPLVEETFKQANNFSKKLCTFDQIKIKMFFLMKEVSINTRKSRVMSLFAKITCIAKS